MTASWHTRDELEHQVVTLAQQGISRRAIARALGVSRNTVKTLLRVHGRQREEIHSALPPSPTQAPRAKKIDAFTVQVAALLQKYPDITAQRVLEILTTEGFVGGYTAVKKYLRTVRPKARPAPSRVTPTYAPGEMAESDWSPYQIHFTAAASAIIHAFSYVLVVSQRKFFEFYPSTDLYALMSGHTRAFERLKGCAAQCKYDSQKPVVLRWEGHQPIYNPRFLAFSSYYEFRPLAVRRGHPNDKPRTERSYWELERSFSQRSRVPRLRRHARSARALARHRSRSSAPTPALCSGAFRQRTTASGAAAGPPLRHGARHLPSVQHRWLRVVGRQSLRGRLRARDRHPAGTHHAARAIRVRSRPALHCAP